MRFWLGTHEVSWLARPDAPPLFISRRRLARQKKWPRAVVAWALDSGGFTELNKFGRWQTSAAQYVAEVRRCRDEVGGMEWAAIQDWMCEPFVLAKTGLSVAEHQCRTVASYGGLLSLAPEIPWTPVLQGWEYGDYWQCLELYDRAGHDLRRLPVVGLGSVCRRQDTGMAADLIRDLKAAGIRVHGFGFKFGGVVKCAANLESADSLAWSFNARKNPPMPGCRHSSCANCFRWAVRWRDRLVEAVGRAVRRPAGGDLYGGCP
jgi:hypothetical protein